MIDKMEKERGRAFIFYFCISFPPSFPSFISFYVIFFFSVIPFVLLLIFNETSLQCVRNYAKFWERKDNLCWGMGRQTNGWRFNFVSKEKVNHKSSQMASTWDNVQTRCCSLQKSWGLKCLASLKKDLWGAIIFSVIEIVTLKV